MKLFILLVLVLPLSFANDAQPVKRSYVCPPKFVRQGHRCYYFSKNTATWQDAMFKCKDLKSRLAIINNAYQDKLIRNVLNSKPVEPLERWLGGTYDWRAMKWKWGLSGKHISYSGFQKTSQEDTDKLKWHCIIMDPAIGYRWNSRPCVEQKHFICHTKMKIVSNKDKKKLQKQYKVNKYNKLNEIPVPTIPDGMNNTTKGTRSIDNSPFKSIIPITYNFEVNQHLNDQALVGYAPKIPAEQTRKSRKDKKKQKRMNYETEKANKRKKKKNKKRRQQEDENDLDDGEPSAIKNIRWKTYKRRGTLVHPLYPRPIIEEYNYHKEA